MDIYGNFPVLSPSSFGHHSLLLNNSSGGGKIQQAKFSFLDGATSNTLRYSFAAMLQKGGLADSIAPYFSVQSIAHFLSFSMANSSKRFCLSTLVVSSNTIYRCRKITNQSS